MARQKVDAFIKTHPHFNKIADEVEFWLKKKLNIDDACYLTAMLDNLKARSGRAP